MWVQLWPDTQRAAWDASKNDICGPGYCRAAGLRGPDTGNLSHRIAARQYPAKSRECHRGSDVLWGLPAGARAEPAVLAAGGRRCGDVGCGQPELDVLRELAAH